MGNKALRHKMEQDNKTERASNGGPDDENHRGDIKDKAIDHEGDDVEDYDPYGLCFLTDKRVSRLNRNDPSLVELRVKSSDWIDGAGLAIGRSKVLRTLIVIFDSTINSLYGLWSCLARNESISDFSLIFKNDFYVDVFHHLVPFFQYNCNLRSLRFVNECESSSSIRPLARVLPKCNTDRLESVQIYWNYTSDDEGVAQLFESLNNKPSLKDLNFGGFDLLLMGCRALANLLRKPSIKIDSLTFFECIIVEAGMNILCNAMTKFNTLQSLCLEDVLFHPLSTLTTMDLNRVGIDDEGLISLGEALAVNKKLRSLNLENNDSITLVGWQGFARCLSNPNSSLKELILQNCNIDDSKAAAIFSLLMENSSLKSLYLFDNDDIDRNGLVAFFDVLLRSKSTVIGDLWLPDSIHFNQITNDEYDILIRALCDTSSIEATYSSNHTFHYCERFDDNRWFFRDKTVYESIEQFLDMNSRGGVEASRQKILEHHFDDEENSRGINYLLQMHATVLPNAIEWIGRDERGYSAMFDFVQNFPYLFDVSCGKSSDKSTKRRKLME